MEEKREYKATGYQFFVDFEKTYDSGENYWELFPWKLAQL
jgi:hypothetical protein